MNDTRTAPSRAPLGGAAGGKVREQPPAEDIDYSSLRQLLEIMFRTLFVPALHRVFGQMFDKAFGPCDGVISLDPRGAVMSQLIDLREVCRRTALSRASVYRAVAAGGFPAPVKVGKRAVRWHSDDITDWILSRPLART